MVLYLIIFSSSTDINLLYKLLQSNYKEMSRFDVYAAEIASGHLEWGIVHNEKFFKEHAKRLEGKDGDFELLRVRMVASMLFRRRLVLHIFRSLIVHFSIQVLIMLAAGDDDDVASIACYDIGEFVRNYPNGRSIAKRLGAKEVVMQLIENDNEELKRHALLCVSKMMVQNWSVRESTQSLQLLRFDKGSKRDPHSCSFTFLPFRRQYDNYTLPS